MLQKRKWSRARVRNVVRRIRCCSESKGHEASTVPPFFPNSYLVAKCCFLAHQTLFKCQVASPVLEQPLSSLGSQLSSWDHTSCCELYRWGHWDSATCVIQNHQGSQKTEHQVMFTIGFNMRYQSPVFLLQYYLGLRCQLLPFSYLYSREVKKRPKGKQSHDYTERSLKCQYVMGQKKNRLQN